MEATLIKETNFPGDASSMIRAGFILVGVAAELRPDKEEPFRYSLIWTRPVEELGEPWG